MEYKQWVVENYFHGGTFSKNDKKEYSVADTVRKLEKAKYPVTSINVKRLVWQLFAGHTHGDEPVGSEGWATRANQAEMNYPILVVRNKDGSIWCADGNHRLWRAYKNGQKQIKAYVVDEDYL